jgi:hypothetical protein
MIPNDAATEVKPEDTEMRDHLQWGQELNSLPQWAVGGSTP